MMTRLVRLALLVLFGVTAAIVIQSLPVVHEHFLNQPASYVVRFLPAEIFWLKLARLGLTPSFYAAYNTISVIMRAAIPWSIAGLILIRRPYDLPALFFSLNLILGSLIPFIPDGRTGIAPAFGTFGMLLVSLSQAYIFSSLYWFPDMKFVPRWTAIMPFFWLSFTLLIAFVPENSVLNPDFAPSWLVYGIRFLLLASLIYSLLFRYRREGDLLKRQQTRLVLFSLVLTLFYLILVNPIIMGRVINIYNFPYSWGILYHLIIDLLISDLLLLFLMVTIGVSILQYRLFAIDVILRQTAIYSILTVSLLVIYGLCVILLERSFRSVTGGHSQLSIVISTIVIASLFMPLKTWLQRVIDWHFYRHRYDADRTLLSFANLMRTEMDLERLAGGLVAAVDAATQPDHIVFWMRKTSIRKTRMDDVWRMLLEVDDDS